MKSVALWFFGTAALAVTLGMTWGLIMAASGDHAMVGAHAHLNLVGWATMGLFGMYYHVVPKAAVGKLPKIHYGVALLGLVLMIPGIAIATNTGNPGLAIAGSVLTFASMLIFLYTIVTTRA